MIKKITIGELRLGMFIHDLDCGWMQHPFLRSRFPIEHDEQISRIAKAGIAFVTIDTERGVDVEPPASPPPREARPEPAPAVPDRPPAARSSCSFEEEFGQAKRIYAEAKQLIQSLMHDVRLGKRLSMDQAEPLLEKMADSILRNPGALTALCRVKSKDEYTFVHSLSVSALMMLFCGAPDDERLLREAGLGGLLHDVGKMMVPEAILNKRGALTDEEFQVMRGHVAAGVAFLQDTGGITQTVLEVVSQHHERVDGKGYPAGLKGTQLSRVGQMAAIVDVYDALTSNRVYRGALSSPEAMKKIVEHTPGHFDREMVRSFVSAVGIYPSGTLVMLQSGRVAVVIDHNRSDPIRPRVRVIYDTCKSSYVEPYDVDLSRSMGRGGADRVLRHENVKRWAFDPLSYLN